LNEPNSLRLLLVEDNKDIAANVCESIELAGHTIDYASSAEMALSILEKTSNDILIIDIMLPGIDGIALCRKIRASALSTAPILMLTARDSVEDKLLAFDAGSLKSIGLSVSGKYLFSKKWFGYSTVGYEKYGDAGKDSPFADNDYDIEAEIGVAYQF